MTRYRASGHYMRASIVSAILAIFSAWCGTRWGYAFIPSALFVLSSVLLAYVGTRPDIELHETQLRIGNRLVGWGDVARIDSTAWFAPLILHLTLRGGSRFRLVYAGDAESSARLLRHLRGMATRALLDGVPYQRYWGEVPTPDASGPQAAETHRLLRPEDEAEVEELYRQLKSVGRLDGPSSAGDRKK